MCYIWVYQSAKGMFSVSEYQQKVCDVAGYQQKVCFVSEYQQKVCAVSGYTSKRYVLYLGILYQQKVYTGTGTVL